MPQNICLTSSSFRDWIQEITSFIGHVSESRYMARLRATGADLGTDDSCNFRLMNTCVIPFLSEMSDLILSLPHIDISIYVVQIIDLPTILGRMSLL